jgi:hypothetical protein
VTKINEFDTQTTMLNIWNKGNFSNIGEAIAETLHATST